MDSGIFEGMSEEDAEAFMDALKNTPEPEEQKPEERKPEDALLSMGWQIAGYNQEDYAVAVGVDDDEDRLELANGWSENTLL